jgi:thiamine biosynthesis protein ThiS
MTTAIAIFVNGERLEVPAGTNVAGVLDLLKLKGDQVAVEMNKCLVRKRDWMVTDITSGAQLEIVEFVGGG